MRVAVTGRHGQVATALSELANREGVEVVLLGRPDLDLAEPETILRAIAGARPDVVVSAAAHTAVDQAESEPDVAFAVNARGAGGVAAAAAAIGVPVVHLSTDYVFPGDLDRPYREDDAVGPASVYGRSKLQGEAEVAAAHRDHAILRTAWVYSPFGKNFVRTMLRVGATRQRLSVVDDQHGSPTSAHAIAGGVLAVARNLIAEPDNAELRGIFHMTGAGYASWAEFAECIFAASRAAGGPFAEVDRIPSSAYPTPAPRPANSRLDCGKLRTVHKIALAGWREPVADCVARILHDDAGQGDR